MSSERSPFTALAEADGLGLVLTGGPTPQDWSQTAQSFAVLEAAGCSALWLTDHLFWGQPMPEALTLAAIAATSTTRCIIGTGVLQLPLRTTAAVAKAATTIAAVSGRRLILGVGVGEHEREYRLAGADFHRRGRDLDRGIDELRALWASTDDEWFVQRPNPEPIPIWVGGRSDAAIARAARRSDGWMPIFVSPDQYESGSTALTEAVNEAGRGTDSVTRAVTVLAAVADDEREAAAAAQWCSHLWNIPARSVERYLVTGTAARIAEVVATYRALGAQHVAVLLATDRPTEMFGPLNEACG